jgi:hypothetical protein
MKITYMNIYHVITEFKDLVLVCVAYRLWSKLSC